MKNTFNKSERLTSKSKIDEIFATGQTLKQFPFLLKFVLDENAGTDKGLKIAFSVPKRKVKLAVKRNRIRRQLKEIYRLNKHEILAELKNEQFLALFLIYTGQEKESFGVLEKKLKLILTQLVETIAANNN